MRIFLPFRYFALFIVLNEKQSPHHTSINWFWYTRYICNTSFWLLYWLCIFSAQVYVHTLKSVWNWSIDIDVAFFLHQTLPYFKFAPPVASTSLSLLLAFAKGSPADVKLPFVCFMQINKCKRRLLLLVLHNESIWGKKVQKCCCPYCPLKCFENVWVAKPKNF